MPSFFLDNTTSVTSNGTLLDPEYTGASLRVDYTQNTNVVKLSLFNTTGDSPFGEEATEASLVGVAFDVVDGTDVNSVLAQDTDTMISNVAGVWNADAQENFGFAPFTGAFDYTLGKLPGIGGNANLYAVVADDDLDVLVNFATSSDAQTWYNSLYNDEIRFAARFQQVNAGEGSDKLYYVTNGDSQPVPEASGILGMVLIFGIGLAAFARKRLAA